MSVEFATPIPVTLADCIRFVFYFKPQRVVDTFDNIPQFHLDIVEKKNLENHQRLYITCKMLTDLWFLDPDEINTKSLQVATLLKEYLKKHFGSKFTIIESMVRSVEPIPYSTREILHDLLNRHQLIQEEVVTHYFTATKRFEKQKASMIRVSPALLGAYIFNFWDNPPIDPSPYTVLRGRAILFGEPMFFEVDNVSDYAIEREAFLQFASPRLMEDTLNQSLRVTHAKPVDAKEVYIQDVQFDED